MHATPLAADRLAADRHQKQAKLVAAGFAAIDDDLAYLVGCFREVLEELGDAELARHLDDVRAVPDADEYGDAGGGDPAGEVQISVPERLAQVDSIWFQLLNMVEENAAQQVRRLRRERPRPRQRAGPLGPRARPAQKPRARRRAGGRRAAARPRRAGPDRPPDRGQADHRYRAAPRDLPPARTPQRHAAHRRRAAAAPRGDQGRPRTPLANGRDFAAKARPLGRAGQPAVLPARGLPRGAGRPGRAAAAGLDGGGTRCGPGAWAGPHAAGDLRPLGRRRPRRPPARHPRHHAREPRRAAPGGDLQPRQVAGRAGRAVEPERVRAAAARGVGPSRAGTGGDPPDALRADAVAAPRRAVAASSPC